jgi:hypothetical protein
MHTLSRTRHNDLPQGGGVGFRAAVESDQTPEALRAAGNPCAPSASAIPSAAPPPSYASKESSYSSSYSHCCRSGSDQGIEVLLAFEGCLRDGTDQRCLLPRAGGCLTARLLTASNVPQSQQRAIAQPSRSCMQACMQTQCCTASVNTHTAVHDAAAHLRCRGRSPDRVTLSNAAGRVQRPGCSLRIS